MLLRGWDFPQSDVFSSHVVRLVALVQPWLLTTWLHRPAHSGPAGSKQGLNNVSDAKQQCISSVRPAKSQRAVADTTCKGIGKAAHRSHSQQQQLSDDQCLPGTHLVSAQDDQESYQGPLGGTVVVPRKDTPLWRAAFYGNVPTHWWLTPSSRSGSLAGSSAAASSQCATTSTSITDWSQLTAQSSHIQQAFRYQDATTPRLRWRHGQLLFGRDTSLGLFRQHSPCPRPAANRLPWPNTRLKVWAMRLQGSRSPVPLALSQNKYMHSRWRAARKQRVQQLQQRHTHRMHRFCSRSKLRNYQRFAVRRAEQLRSFLCEFPLSSDGQLNKDIVPAVSGSEMMRQAQDFARAAANVSKCAAQKDERGRIVTSLPEDCIGAGCQRDIDGRCTSSSGSSRADALTPIETSSCLASSSRLPEQRVGRRQRMSADSRSAHVTQYLNNLFADTDGEAPGIMEQQGQHGSPNAAAVGDSEQQQLAKLVRMQKELHLLEVFINERGFSNTSSTSPLSAVQRDHPGGSRFSCEHGVHSDSEWDDDGDDDGDGMSDDSDLESDDDDDEVSFNDDDDGDGVVYAYGSKLNEVELPVEIHEVLDEPYVFRNDQNVLYGFWAKCPLG